MKKNLLYVTTIALIMLLFAACSNEDVFDGIDKNPELATGRTISLTATMPDGSDDAPNTRVSLTQDADRNIDLKWMKGDVIEVAFMQGENGPEIVELSSYELMDADILDDGKRARFNLTIPDVIDLDKPIHLCGVYGGGGLRVEDGGGGPGPMPMNIGGGGRDEKNIFAVMPTNPGSATSLADLDSPTSIESRKDVMLYFFSFDVDVAKPQMANFIHIGSLFNITIKNTSATTLTNLSAARLVGIGGWGDWVCNVGKGGGVFKLLEEGFYEAAKLGNYISLKAPAETLAPNELMTFWGWYPPNPEAVSPELKLELIANNTYTSFNTKAERTEATTAVAGKSYYFFAEWDGTKLGFSDQDFKPQPGLYEHNVDNEGHLNSLSNTDKESITAMKVTGLLNNDDFEVMKNQMPQLRYLDLLDATCVDNAIPSKAFGSGIFTRSSGDGASDTPNQTIITLTLPSSITSIGAHAFHGCIGLSGSLIIPNGVTSIGESAFEDCTGFFGDLTTPNSLRTIGASAFSGCKGFSGDLIISNGVTEIGEAAFSNCYGFKGSLSIPNSVTTIGASAFTRCTGFTGDLVIPNGVISIGVSAFSSCIGFTGDLIIPNSVISIGKSAFFECNSLEGTLTLSNFLDTIEESTFSANFFTGHLTIPANVKTIEASAFWYCDGFTGMTLPIGLKSIGADAFWGCEGFTGDLMLPPGLESIGSGAFGNCTGFTGGLHIPMDLTTIEAEAFTHCSGFDGMLMLPIGLTSIGEDAFKYCSGLSGSLFIPNGVTTIGAKAFSHCSSFTGPLTIPNSVATIGENAFDKCYGFDGELTLPTTLTTIERATFFGCSGLIGDLTIPEGVTTIELFAFEGCTGLNGKVVLPTSLTSVKHMAFEKCTNVTAFRFLRHTPIPYYVRHWNNLGDDLFLPSNANIEVPSAALATYKAADGWKNHNPSIKGFFSLDGVLPNPQNGF